MKALKTLILIVATIGLYDAEGASAQDSVSVSAVVETADALYFQPLHAPGIVWYFPKSALQFGPVSPPIPGQDYYRAGVVLPDLGAVDPGALNQSWAGASLVPYILRPTTPCVLQRFSGMQFVQQEIRADGRDVSAAIDTPVCQFSFRLSRRAPSESRAQLTAAGADGSLIARQLTIVLRIGSSVPWSAVHAAVAAELDAAHGDRSVPEDAARGALEAALSALGVAISADDLSATLETLFVPASAGLRLVRSAPPGDAVHHGPATTYLL